MYTFRPLSLGVRMNLHVAGSGFKIQMSDIRLVAVSPSFRCGVWRRLERMHP